MTLILTKFFYKKRYTLEANMTRSLYNSWLSGWVLKKADKQIETQGLVVGMNKLICQKFKLIVKNREKIKSILKNDRVIVISNHPSQAEVLITLGIMEQRDDLYLVANSSFLKILPSADKHIIPVYTNHRLAKTDKDKWKYNLLTKLHQSDLFEKEMAHEKNIESINKATEKINQGGLVIIYPIDQQIDKFLCGLGFMIKNLKTPKKVKIIMMHVRGTSTWDYLRLIPFIGQLLPTVRIDFSGPIEVDKLEGIEAKEITRSIEKRYYDWVKTKHLL